MSEIQAKPATLLEAVKTYGDLDNALTESADSRWRDGVICVHCGADSPMFLKTRRIWKCSKCRKQFSFKAGTVMEDSPIGLDKWLPAIWMIANDRNGISSHELARSLGITQKSAWFVLHRVRLAMQASGGMLDGEVEVDETYIGGKARNMHKRQREARKSDLTGGFDKTVVVGALQRGGHVRATVANNRKKNVMQPFIRANVKPGAQIHSDEHASSWRMDGEYSHEVVNHLEKYVDGNVTTNRIENFWSLLKRGLNGTYVSVEPFHLFRYVDEAAFRYNHRRTADGVKTSDYSRFKEALRCVVGKRITYKKLIGKE